MLNAMQYNPWPIGKLPDELKRPELELVKEYFNYSDPREIIGEFERMVAEFAGSKFAVAVDCCTHAIELSLRLKNHLGQIKEKDIIYVPENTYVSVPMTLYHLGFNVQFKPEKWEGLYSLDSVGKLVIVDGAVRWKRGMYIEDSLHCLSFQIKKRIPIGRGGMILTNDYDYYKWLKLASYDGRDLDTPYDSDDHIKLVGFHYYMTPEDAARGIILMNKIKQEGDSGGWMNYPNLLKWLKH
jgi:dTDP-4-amino-4,6-dideoxygalactose transaminase